MLCGGQPELDNLLELLGGHSSMRGHDDFQYRSLTAGEHGLDVALEKRRERLLFLPLGMLRRERLHAVQDEEQLEIHRLLCPERAVVVKHRYALGRRHEVGRTL